MISLLAVLLLEGGANGVRAICGIAGTDRNMFGTAVALSVVVNAVFNVTADTFKVLLCSGLCAIAAHAVFFAVVIVHLIFSFLFDFAFSLSFSTLAYSLDARDLK